jgi:hypothetical protein
LVIVARDLKQNVSDGLRERDSGRDVRLAAKGPPLSVDLCNLNYEWDLPGIRGSDGVKIEPTAKTPEESDVGLDCFANGGDQSTVKKKQCGGSKPLQSCSLTGLLQ